MWGQFGTEHIVLLVSFEITENRDEVLQYEI